MILALLESCTGIYPTLQIQYHVQCYFHVHIKVPCGLMFLVFNLTIKKFSYLIFFINK